MAEKPHDAVVKFDIETYSDIALFSLRDSPCDSTALVFVFYIFMCFWVVAGIAVCDLGGHCVEEAADTTLCLILDMYRRTYWLARDVGFCNRRITCAEQLFDLASGATRIRGQTLGIVGFGLFIYCS